MPNHVTNVLHVDNPEVIKSILDDNGYVDFNNIISMPKELEDTEFPVSEETAKITNSIINLVDFLKKTVPQQELEEKTESLYKVLDSVGCSQYTKYVKVYKECGCIDWRSWCLKYWGTKWNAFEQDKSENLKTRVKFSTAWNMPEALYKELSKKFPNETITVEYADEDIGSNCGIVTYKNGEETSSDISDDHTDPEWIKFSLNLQNKKPEDYGYNEHYESVND